MKKVCALMIVGLVATAASAQWGIGASFTTPAWSPGDFMMTDLGGNHFQSSFVLDGSDTAPAFKVALPDWSEGYPPNNVLIPADTTQLAIDFYHDTYADGWLPEANRVGYTSDGTIYWEIVGSMNDWGDGWTMTDAGNGMYTYTADMLAGDYDMKFRADDNWDFAIGNNWDMGQGSGNIAINIPADGMYTFELNIAGGCFRVTPEPATLAMLAIGGLVVIRRR